MTWTARETEQGVVATDGVRVAHFARGPKLAVLEYVGGDDVDGADLEAAQRAADEVWHNPDDNREIEAHLAKLSRAAEIAAMAPQRRADVLAAERTADRRAEGLSTGPVWHARNTAWRLRDGMRR